MKSRYPEPHRKMYLAWKSIKGIRLSWEDLNDLFLTDDAVLMAATQEFSEVEQDLLDQERQNNEEDAKKT